MKLRKSLLCGLALAGSLVASNAYADQEYHGLEARLAATGSIIDQHVSIGHGGEYDHAAYLWGGINGTLSIGYRWGKVGLYVDQDLGGVWWTGEIKDENGKVKPEDQPDPAFIGGTYLMLRGLIPAREHAEFDIGFGFGTMYSGGNNTKGSVLIYDDKLNRSAAFAFKVEFGLTYYFFENVGLGINLDYNLGLNIFDSSLDKNVCALVEDGCDDGPVYHLVHQINPGIHVVAQF